MRHKTIDSSIFTNYPIVVQNVRWIRDLSAEDTLSTIGSVSKGVISVLSVMVIPASASAFIFLIKVVQMFNYFNFLNIEKPSNLNEFLSKFRSNILSFLPNPLAKDSYDEREENEERRLLTNASFG